MASDPQNLAIQTRSDVYPGIDVLNNPALKECSRGKVVLITGASRGIGEATATAFALSGAKALFLCARTASALVAVKEKLLDKVPSVEVEFAVMDVTRPEDVERAVQRCVREFGRLDVVISNAGARGIKCHISLADPKAWWDSFGPNLCGNYLIYRYTVHELAKAGGGHIIFVSSIGSHYHVPEISDYVVAKHALNRLAERIAVEHEQDNIKSIAIHPGGIKTELTKDAPPAVAVHLVDDVNLPAYSIVRLCSGSEDWLSGRYFSVNWDLDELNSDKFKTRILEEDSLKTRLRVPAELAGGRG
ncbi:short-chain dehydrogenase/reductase SDR [Atractiella rhizophila]|nr:short-chain dehydrogenase/reductase SDR [Atractiella rhizophila]